MVPDTKTYVTKQRCEKANTLTQTTLPVRQEVSLSQRGPHCTPGNSQFDQLSLRRSMKIETCQQKNYTFNWKIKTQDLDFSRGNCTAHPRPPDGAVLTGHGADPPHRIRQVRASCRESSDKLMTKQAQDHVNWVSGLLPCCGSFSVTEKLLCSSAPPVYLCPGRVKSPFSAARTWSH